jgi:Zn-dependent protease
MSRLIVPFRMHNTGWVLLIFCVLLGIQIGGLQLALPIGALLIASLLLHEVGHMLAATALRVPVREFGLRLGGAYNRRAYATRRRDELIISVSGPLMNFFLVVPLLFVPRLGAQLAVCNLLLCVVNLLPLPSSDGLRILRTLWSFTSPRRMVPGLGQNRLG